MGLIVVLSLGMKQLIILLFLITTSASAFAQFPLGSTAGQIKAYFGDNVQYASLQEFKTKDDVKAICFTKVRVVGDYTFYFDDYGKCSSYVVTYDLKDEDDVIHRFDNQFCRMEAAEWEALDKTFNVTLAPKKAGANYFSIVYKPRPDGMMAANTLASN